MSARNRSDRSFQAILNRLSTLLSASSAAASIECIFVPIFKVHHLNAHDSVNIPVVKVLINSYDSGTVIALALGHSQPDLEVKP